MSSSTTQGRPLSGDLKTNEQRIDATIEHVCPQRKYIYVPNRQFVFLTSNVCSQKAIRLQTHQMNRDGNSRGQAEPIGDAPAPPSIGDAPALPSIGDAPAPPSIVTAALKQTPQVYGACAHTHIHVD